MRIIWLLQINDTTNDLLKVDENNPTLYALQIFMCQNCVRLYKTKDWEQDLRSLECYSIRFIISQAWKNKIYRVMSPSVVLGYLRANWNIGLQNHKRNQWPLWRYWYGLKKTCPTFFLHIHRLFKIIRKHRLLQAYKSTGLTEDLTDI